MMFFLSINVARDLRKFVLAQGEDSVTFLPSKFELGIDLFIYTKRSRAFYLSDKLCNQHCGRQPTKQVSMIRHRVANGPAAARFDFFVDDFKKLQSPDAIDKRFAGVRGPGEVIIELVEYVRHLSISR